ncbi:helix-turn-helix transcriptional regulator [Micromonospora vulcania]
MHWSDTQVSGVETGTRIARDDFWKAVDEALETGGFFLTFWREFAQYGGTPTWLREWIEIEREATALHWFEPAYIPGLLQIEAYSRATLAGGRFTAEEVEQLVASRLERQAILAHENRPQIVAVIDEAALRRPVRGRPEVMREQLEHLVSCIDEELAQVHVVPADVGVYLGLAGQFIIASMTDGTRSAYADNQLSAQIVANPADVARLAKTWEHVRSHALPMVQSLDLIKEAAKTWT